MSLPISRRPNLTKFEQNTSFGVVINLSEHNFEKFSRKRSLFAKNAKKWNIFQRLATLGRHNSLLNDPSTRCLVYIFFIVGINSTSFPWPVHYVKETFPNYFLRRRTRVDGTADNADISQSQAASDGRLKITACIEYKLLSLTYKVLITTQPPYLHNLISVQPPRSTRSSSLVTIARPR